MIISGNLSLAEQAMGRKYWHIFNMLNAASFVCVADNVLFLFALELGCPSYLIPVLASFMYLGFLAMPLGKALTARVGAAYSISFFWIMRNVFALLTAAAPFLLVWDKRAAIAVVMLGSLGFYASRSAGVVSINPVIGEICTSAARGRFTVANLRNFNIIALIGLGLISYAMREFSSILTFQVIILCGALAGLVSGLVISRVKESVSLRDSARIPLMSSLRALLSQRSGRKLVMANAAVLSGILLVLPVSMTALKEVYHVSDSSALLFALVQFFGGIVIASAAGMVVSHSGPRPIVIMSFSLLLLSSGMWLFAPPSFSWWYMGLIFFLNGASSLGTPNALTHYFLNLVRERDRMGYSLFSSVIGGTAAGVCSFLVGGGLLKALPWCGLSGMAMYKTYFLVALLLLAMLLAVLFSLERVRDWEVGRLLSLAFAPRDVQALLLMNRMESPGGEEEELQNIERLGQTHSAMSARKILSYLDTPKLLVRSKALLALRGVPFGEEVRERLLQELRFGTFTTAPLAAQILGEHGVKSAIPELRTKLDSENPYLAGRALAALAQLEDRESYGRIKGIFRDSANQFIIINGAAALSIIGDQEAVELLLEKIKDESLDRSVRGEIYSAIADVGGVGDEFFKLFRQYFTCEEIRNPLCVGFVESLGHEPLSEELKAMLEDYNEGRCGAGVIMSRLIERSAKSSRMLVKLVRSFLESMPPEKMGKVLLSCLMGICRKHGVEI